MSLNFDFKIATPQLKRPQVLQLLRYLPLATLIVLLGATTFSILFLYRNFYQTIAQAKVVSILRNQVSLHQVNLPLYQKVFDAWENKKRFAPAYLNGLKDPFLPLPVTPPTTDTGEALSSQPSPTP